MKEPEDVASCDKQFIASALREDVRIDGRGLLDLRKLCFEFPPDGSSASVKLGRTHVLASVSSVLGHPSSGRPQEGTVHFNVDLSPMASPAFDADSRRYDDFLIQRLVERNFYFSRALDLEALCIVAGSTVWNLNVDIHILDHDGNLTDACCLCALAALSVHRHPQVTVREGQENTTVIHSPEVRDPIPLNLHHLPIAVTFALFEHGDVVAVDPCLKEEGAMSGSITVVVDTQGCLCGLNKTKGIGLSMSQAMRIVRLAVTQGAEVARALQEALHAHETSRVQARVKRKEIAETISHAEGMKAMVMKVPVVHSEGHDWCNAEIDLHAGEYVVSSSEGGPCVSDDVSTSSELEQSSDEELEDEQMANEGPVGNDSLLSNATGDFLPYSSATCMAAAPVKTTHGGVFDRDRIERAAAIVAGVGLPNVQGNVVDGLSGAVKKKAQQ